MRGWAIGLLHLSVPEFGEMRLGVFWEAMAAHQEEKDMDRRHMGELIRGESLRAFNLQVKKSDKISDPRKYWPMPWDAPDEVTTAADRLNNASQEERDEAVKAFLHKLGEDNG